MWQDKVIFVCQAGAIVALFPILRDKQKPALSACIMNSVFAGTVSITLSTLRFWYSTTTAALISIGWFIIALQKTKYAKAVVHVAEKR